MASRRALREAIVLLPDLRATPRFHPPRKERRGAGYRKGEGKWIGLILSCWDASSSR